MMIARRGRHLSSALGLSMLVGLLTASCKEDEPAVDRVWYTADDKTSPPPCLPKEDARVVTYLEKTWGKSGTRCVKRLDYGPEEQDRDGNGDKAFATTCLYGVIWKDC